MPILAGLKQPDSRTYEKTDFRPFGISSCLGGVGGGWTSRGVRHDAGPGGDFDVRNEGRTGSGIGGAEVAGSGEGSDGRRGLLHGWFLRGDGEQGFFEPAGGAVGRQVN